jgi:hypothetical protein
VESSELLHDLELIGGVIFHDRSDSDNGRRHDAVMVRLFLCAAMRKKT